MQSKEHFYLLIVLLAAFLVRITGITGFSLSNDELSALARLQFDSVADVITHGVYVDFHPAGVQLFLYIWTSVFGISELAVRTPFALMGVAAVYFLYKTGRLWFGASTGILAAAALALLEYPLLYSQIARPYSPGLLCSLMAVFFWTKALLGNDDKSSTQVTGYGYFAAFALSVSACMYIHYFSFIFAGIICFAGLFFLTKKTVVPYLISGVVILLLYFPHYGIFIHQLSKGGVGGADGWLGKPGSDAFLKYIEYIFNDSVLLKYIYFIVAGGTILSYRGGFKITRFHLLCVLFFIIPFAIAYYYSIYVNPVYQHSVLLFSFPFLLLLIFSFIPSDRAGTTLSFLLTVVIAGTAYSTVIEKKYYSTPHFSEFRNVALKIREIDHHYGKKHVTHAINIFDPYYINYYLDRLKYSVDFSIYTILNESQKRQFYNLVQGSSTDYFVYSYSNTYFPPEFDLAMRSVYPWVLLNDSMFNSGVIMYSRIPSDSSLNRLPDFKYSYGFESGQWNNESLFRDSQIKDAGEYSVFINSSSEFGPGYQTVFSPSIHKYEISARFLSTADDIEAKLVLSIEKNGVTYFWKGVSLKEFINNKQQWFSVYMVADLPDGIPIDAEVKIYCWNEKLQEVWMDEFQLNAYSVR